MDPNLVLLIMVSKKYPDKVKKVCSSKKTKQTMEVKDNTHNYTRLKDQLIMFLHTKVMGIMVQEILKIRWMMKISMRSDKKILMKMIFDIFKANLNLMINTT